METGAIVAVTTHGGAAADTATVEDDGDLEAGVAVAGLIAEKTPEGKYEVHPGRSRRSGGGQGIPQQRRCAGLQRNWR